MIKGFLDFDSLIVLNRSKDAEISALQTELSGLKHEVVSMREDLLQITTFPESKWLERGAESG
jgi:hypothetical protein